MGKVPLFTSGQRALLQFLTQKRRWEGKRNLRKQKLINASLCFLGKIWVCSALGSSIHMRFGLMALEFMNPFILFLKFSC